MSGFAGGNRTYAVTNSNRLYGWGGMARFDWQWVYREPSTIPTITSPPVYS